MTTPIRDKAGASMHVCLYMHHSSSAAAVTTATAQRASFFALLHVRRVKESSMVRNSTRTPRLLACPVGCRLWKKRCKL